MQRYKVFVNAHVINVFEKRTKNRNVNNLFHINNPSRFELSVLGDFLIKEPGSLHVDLTSSDVEGFWEKFQSNFEIVSAAGGLVLRNNAEVLLIHRLGFWDLPKGKIEINESIEQAAIREVEEECNLFDLKIDKKLPTSYHIYQRNGEKILKPTYWFKMTSKKGDGLKPQIEEGIDEVKWLNFSEIPDYIDAMYPSLQVYLKQLIA